jgi:hypothetical protein
LWGASITLDDRASNGPSALGLDYCVEARSNGVGA